MAAVDYFLKIEGIDGESADHKHKGEIQVESWSFASRQNHISALQFKSQILSLRASETSEAIS